MVYSQQLTWNAIYEFCPHHYVVKSSGNCLCIVEALNDAAVAGFMYDNSSLNGYAKDRDFHARLIIRTALREIKEEGKLSFGDVNKIWQ